MAIPWCYKPHVSVSEHVCTVSSVSAAYMQLLSDEGLQKPAHMHAAGIDTLQTTMMLYPGDAHDVAACVDVQCWMRQLPWHHGMFAPHAHAQHPQPQDCSSPSPKPGERPAAASCPAGVQRPAITSCALGLGLWAVIQNHRAVLKARTGSCPTASGLLMPSKPRALPALK
jgi:hypothetical protein